MHADDAVRLRHMLDAAREALSFADGRERGAVHSDRMLLHSLVRCVEIIGEAAAQVSAQKRKQLAGIPWPDVVGMRNRLIHAYFDVDPDRVWDTVIDDLPPLVKELERGLAEQPDKKEAQTDSA
jgi:uncharacterized protein with HEPN domain